jgi:hypothetical protein
MNYHRQGVFGYPDRDVSPNCLSKHKLRSPKGLGVTLMNQTISQPFIPSPELLTQMGYFGIFLLFAILAGLIYLIFAIKKASKNAG